MPVSVFEAQYAEEGLTVSKYERRVVKPGFAARRNDATASGEDGDGINRGDLAIRRVAYNLLSHEEKCVPSCFAIPTLATQF